jgi:glycosyl transferase family 87
MDTRKAAVTCTKPGPKEYQRAAFLAVALLPSLFAAAVLWILPVGDLTADRTALAARDYTDMWAAGHLAALGKGDIFFDLGKFNLAIRGMFGAGFPEQIWPYPPPILLIAVPLSTLPLLPGFLLYTCSTLGLLWAALRSGGMTRAACGAVLLSPAVADNALAGQNAALTGALRWSPIAGQFGGLVKLGSGCCHAASFVAPSVQYASSGVRPARVECGRRAL